MPTTRLRFGAFMTLNGECKTVASSAAVFVYWTSLVAPLLG
jgi:hypothetical protein